MKTETKQGISSKSEQLDYQKILEQYPWVTTKNQNCILSPDSDGLLCGLLMSHYLNWKIVGFYDGKALLIKRGIHPRRCVFLDMEIFRPEIRSVGQHMVMFNKNDLPSNWSNFKNCIAANSLRNFDFIHNFKEKYPFGTIHLLLGILGQKHNIAIPKSALSILLYTDGTFKNQFNYPENCLGWLTFLRAYENKSPLQKIFLNQHYSAYELMTALKDLFVKINIIGEGKRGGDKIKISDSKGRITNINLRSGKMSPTTVNQAKNFLKLIALKTGWQFKKDHWLWGPYRMFSFQKGGVKPGKARYRTLLAQNPLSLAIISRNSIEHTLDKKGVF